MRADLRYNVASHWLRRCPWISMNMCFLSTRAQPQTLHSTAHDIMYCVNISIILSIYNFLSLEIEKIEREYFMRGRISFRQSDILTWYYLVLMAWKFICHLQDSNALTVPRFCPWRWICPNRLRWNWDPTIADELRPSVRRIRLEPRRVASAGPGSTGYLEMCSVNC